MKKGFLLGVLILLFKNCFCWGFFAHQKINYFAVFLLPPEMIVLFKPNIGFLSEHSVDPDKRRYAVPEEGPRHFIDIDKSPLKKFKGKLNEAPTLSEDTFGTHGILPWWTLKMLKRLTNAFRERDQTRILKLSAEIGHYISDAYVPLHACHNYNGQFTDQKGIHAFWESRVPELLADKEWNFFIGRAAYIKDPSKFIWKIILESAAAADTVLSYEKELGRNVPRDQKFSFEKRNEKIIRQYSTAYSIAYNNKLKGMIERRMRGSIFAIASLWYTAWVNAGQPDLKKLMNREMTPEDVLEYQNLNSSRQNTVMKGWDCE